MHSYSCLVYSSLVYSIEALVFLMSTPENLIVPPKGGFLRREADTADMHSEVGGASETDFEGGCIGRVSVREERQIWSMDRPPSRVNSRHMLGE